MSKSRDHFWSVASGGVIVPAVVVSAMSAGSPFAPAVIIAASFTIVEVIHRADEFKPRSAAFGVALSLAAAFGAFSNSDPATEIAKPEPVQIISEPIDGNGQVRLSSPLQVSVPRLG